MEFCLKKTIQKKRVSTLFCIQLYKKKCHILVKQKSVGNMQKEFSVRRVTKQ
jgi:hypothetical protein